MTKWNEFKSDSSVVGDTSGFCKSLVYVKVHFRAKETTSTKGRWWSVKKEERK